MTIIRLWGGLGNQLFQYSLGKYLEHHNASDVVYCLSMGEDNQIGYLVDDIKLIPYDEVEVPDYWNESGLKDRITRKIYQKLPIFNREILVEDSLWFKNEFSKVTKAFDGYWQSFKYLKEIENNLRSKIQFKPEDLGTLKSLAKITEFHSVSLHIRRGDYLKGKNKHIFANCDLAYYENAIKQLMLQYDDLSFFIFSNDPIWVKSNFDLSKFDSSAFTFVLNSGELNGALADMFLMSRCKHNIIANSTFSWWGAWLNENPEKTVIAPQNWYVGDRNKYADDLIPPHWVRIHN